MFASGSGTLMPLLSVSLPLRSIFATISLLLLLLLRPAGRVGVSEQSEVRRRFHILLKHLGGAGLSACRSDAIERLASGKFAGDSISGEEVSIDELYHGGASIKMTGFLMEAAY